MSSSASALRTEFDSWALEGDKRLKLIQVEETEGRVWLRFGLASSVSRRFTLYCPTSYPEFYSDEENFFVEADAGLQLWCNALNEFILDADKKLKLCDILTKGLLLYSDTDQEPNDVNDVAHDEDDNDDDINDEDDDDDDDDVMDDDDLEDNLEDELQWELEVARLKKRWRRKEQELRNKSHPESSNSERSKQQQTQEDRNRSLQELYHDPSLKSRQPKQVFTPSGASGILINDLVSIMQSHKQTGIEVDAIDDNIFQWNVKIRNFKDNPPLENDFMELQRLFGYDFIELQLDFSMDLYPFFPPLVKVIRPRLQGSMMLRVTYMEILKLSYWNPATALKSVLCDIKAFINTWARLDLNSERNDRTRYKNGAYIDIEHHLLRLALVSEVAPRANKKYSFALSKVPKASLPNTAMESTTKELAASSSRVRNLALVESVVPKHIKSKLSLFSSNKEKEAEKKSRSKMAKGTGYSTHNHKGWDVKAYMAAQREKDRQIEIVLEQIVIELKKINAKAELNENTSSQNDGNASKDGQVEEVLLGQSKSGGPSRSGSCRKRKHSPDELVGVSSDDNDGNNDDECDDNENEGASVDPLSDMFAVLEGSALIPFLESKVQANSFLEISNHPSVYKWVVAVLQELVAQPCLVPLLGPLPDQQSSLQSLLSVLETQARILLDKIGRAAANGSVPKSSKATSSAANDANSGDKLAREFLSLSMEVTKALRSGSPSRGVEPSSTSSDSDKRSNGTVTLATPEMELPEANQNDTHQCPDKPTTTMDEELASRYKNLMRPLQLESCDISLSGCHSHAFAQAYQQSSSPSSSVIFRVAQEVSSLPTSLPLELSSSIFVRSDDDKTTLWRAIVTGPEDTPYTGGCYLFDIFFPSSYPKSAPHVSFRTTGGGVVRFNPNLYNCGKVCLSLLGTWEGSQGEQWNATSTILQVLISIQSLILCPEPYFNEPGYDRMYGTSAGTEESLRYSEDIFRQNMKHAILGQLQNPPEGFEQMVKMHFLIKRDKLIQELEANLVKYKCGRDGRRVLADVKRELLKLSYPSEDTSADI